MIRENLKTVQECKFNFRPHNHKTVSPLESCSNGAHSAWTIWPRREGTNAAHRLCQPPGAAASTSVPYRREKRRPMEIVVWNWAIITNHSTTLHALFVKISVCKKTQDASTQVRLPAQTQCWRKKRRDTETLLTRHLRCTDTVTL